uniref:Uncharacterized protein n=1 Tax=Arundo donax TaxID=35708 RepID=A0A0A9BPU5_ARUDO
MCKLDSTKTGRIVHYHRHVLASQNGWMAFKNLKIVAEILQWLCQIIECSRDSPMAVPNYQMWLSAISI